ncbi:hypothetical protein JCM15765_08700 [Paradesulfitobacterium aromaticivorans]
MTKSERQKRQQCRDSGCRYYAQACEVFHGAECKQLGGNKIPRMRYYEKGRPDFVPERPLGSLMKPHFLQA